MTNKINKAESPVQISFVKALMLTLPMMLFTFMILSAGKIPTDPNKIIALAVSFIFVNTIFFLMLYREKTDKYRAALFIAYAVCFVISFISNLIEIRGSMAISQENLLLCKTPFCHIVIPMTIIPLALSKTIIFPGTIIGSFASIASMLIIWIGASLALGRGFCGWGCFFGGLDDGFSRIFRKPMIKHINPKWHYLPFAVLLAVALTSAMLLNPTYCEWLCPYKTVTEYVEVTSVKIFIQTIIFVTLFLGLVIILPMLTRKRTQCGLFCPFGAFQSFTNKINPFEIRVNQENCIKCKQCIQACPAFSMTEETLEKGKTRFTCIKCGKCVDTCPKGALYFHVKGTPFTGNASTYRLLFLYPAFLFLVTMASRNFQDVIIRIIRLITTGSILSL
ncbi:MAG: 4Fe-4S binding protein [Proteobacteria bacterium]|nr:4Fe-4S binding protein [Pseudomonadota bacterium]